ncbi:MAG: phospholipase A [Campylobacterota bacterium]|nr:phospholipase A [Campylobacterota bacterium]
MKKIVLNCLLSVSLFASNSILDEISSTLDNNITDKIKLENIQEYIDGIDFNDDYNKSKYSFNIMSHYENYMLLGSYSPTNIYEKAYGQDAQRDPSNDYKRNSNEAQYQLSIKVPLYTNFLNTGAELFTGYTQNSYWQVYNTAHSSPFRETNYMPELFMEWNLNKDIGNSLLKTIRVAIIHQSNGQDLGKSRSWNRTEMMFLFQKENIFYGFNAWNRWDEEVKSSRIQIEGDDNVNLQKYIGKQKYFIKYKSDIGNILLSHQNSLFGYNINKGNTKLDLTFPSPNKNVDFFIRGFHGYGESLIDYDVKINRVSFGIMIADWL